MKKAAELGSQWVEFDVRLSRDGVLVVFHDAGLQRTTNGKGLVAETDLADLQALDAGGWFSKEFAGEAIPTLSQVAGELARLGLGANVEIKQGAETARAAARFLANLWPDNSPPPLISSFHEDALAAAAETAPQISRALCINKIPPDWRQRLDGLGCAALHCKHDRLKPEQAAAAAAAGVALRCYTVNRASRALKLFGWGVNAVFSDFPERISKRMGGSGLEC